MRITCWIQRCVLYLRFCKFRSDITAIVPNCKIGVIVGLARREADFIQSVEDHNHLLFEFLIWFRFLFGSCPVASEISIRLPHSSPIGPTTVLKCYSLLKWLYAGWTIWREVTIRKNVWCYLRPMCICTDTIDMRNPLLLLGFPLPPKEFVSYWLAPTINT
jgi:hypothetical protein